jgi:CheY-like chemotaxis protein
LHGHAQFHQAIACKTLARRNSAGTAPVKSTDGKNSSANKSLRILLVEDEMLIRLSTAEMLAEMGHTVIEAGDADEALQLLYGQGADLLLTDVGLPRISGAELARETRKRFPTIPVIFASGYTSVADGGAIENAVVLTKPFDERQLVSALAKATGSQS